MIGVVFVPEPLFAVLPINDFWLLIKGLYYFTGRSEAGLVGTLLP